MREQTVRRVCLSVYLACTYVTYCCLDRDGGREGLKGLCGCVDMRMRMVDVWMGAGEQGVSS